MIIVTRVSFPQKIKKKRGGLMPFFVYSYGKQTTVQRESFILIWHMQLLMNTAVLILMGSLIIIQI